jgi:hypothetical protein
VFLEAFFFFDLDWIGLDWIGLMFRVFEMSITTMYFSKNAIYEFMKVEEEEDEDEEDEEGRII